MKKNLLILSLAVAMLSGTAAFAENTPEASENDIMLISLDEETAKRPEASGETNYYLTVSEVSEGTVTAVDSEENTYTFSLDSASVLYSNDGKQLSYADITKDSSIKLIAMPAEDGVLTPSAVILMSDAQNDADVDYYVPGTVFGDLENAKFDLALNLSEETEIVDEEGNAVAKDALANRKLIVFYQQVAMSLPAQTSPSKIIVLSEQGVSLETAKIETVDGKTAFPLREVCEGLGFEVTWNAEKAAVQVGTEQMGSYLTIGENKYTFAKRAAEELEFAPTLITKDEYAYTYVPASFFTEILGLQTIQTSGGILIAE